MKYYEYCNYLLERNSGSVEHHIIPLSVQKKMMNGIFNEDIVKCTPQEHLWLHILYDREYETGTRDALWMNLSNCKSLNWESCLFEDLSSFNEDWDGMKRKVSEKLKGGKTHLNRVYSDESRLKNSMHNAMKRPECQRKNALKHRHYIYTVQEPDGTVTTPELLYKYCKDHKLDAPTLLSKGRTKGYKLLAKEKI